MSKQIFETRFKKPNKVENDKFCKRVADENTESQNLKELKEVYNKQNYVTNGEYSTNKILHVVQKFKDHNNNEQFHIDEQCFNL